MNPTTSKDSPTPIRMTSRQRVLMALRHREPDRLPIDFGSMRSTGIMAIAYARLKKHLGLSTGKIRVYDMFQQLAEVEPDVLQRFGIDVIDLSNTLGEDDPSGWNPWTLPDGTPCLVPATEDLRPAKDGGWYIWKEGLPHQRMPPGGLYFDRVYHPLSDAANSADLKAYQWPRLNDETLRDLQRRAEVLNKHTDFAIMAHFGGNILETGQGLRGWEQFMIDLVDKGAFLEDLLGLIVEAHLTNLPLFLEAVGDYVQIIQFGDDLGMQDRPLISPRMYQETIKPCHQQIYSYVHQHSNCSVFLHSCGSIYQLIPDLIDVGVNILNPVQTSAANMAPARLKTEFGEQITFWGGGCNTQQVLPNATPDEVAKHVLEQIQTFAPGGGFIFNQIHNIQANVPPENVVAMFDEASSYQGADSGTR